MPAYRYSPLTTLVLGKQCSLLTKCSTTFTPLYLLKKTLTEEARPHLKPSLSPEMKLGVYKNRPYQPSGNQLQREDNEDEEENITEEEDKEQHASKRHIQDAVCLKTSQKARKTQYERGLQAELNRTINA